MDRSLSASAMFEHQFWLQILGDHSRFIFASLAPKETEEIDKSLHFIQVFDSLLAQSRECASGGDLMDMTKTAYQHVTALRDFKLHLLCRQLAEGIEFHLPPTFVNHMVNELEEYCLVLTTLMEECKLPICHPVHYHKVWLRDAVGHAATINCQLDEVERDLKQKSKCFAENFSGLEKKALEFEGYLRTGLETFPALERFNCQADKEMNLFKCFLTEMLELRISLEALGTLSPLAPDHMYREECYYLTKLAQLGTVPMPQCDPTKPRINV